jgi:hypothetical protein
MQTAGCNQAGVALPDVVPGSDKSVKFRFPIAFGLTPAAFMWRIRVFNSFSSLKESNTKGKIAEKYEL